MNSSFHSGQRYIDELIKRGLLPVNAFNVVIRLEASGPPIIEYSILADDEQMKSVVGLIEGIATVEIT